MAKTPKYLKLSHGIKPGVMPLYPGTPLPRRIDLKSMKAGDSCNASGVMLSLHSGTHVDFPGHFREDGRLCSDYSLTELIFKRPVVCHCPKGREDEIDVSDLKSFSPRADADALIIKTGFSSYRDKRPSVYTSESPFVTPAAARWLKKRMKSLRAIGIDCVSFSSFADRKAGRETHRVFLGDKKNPVILIEDMRLPEGLDRLDELMVCPIFIEGAEAAPCTVIGVRHD